MDLLFINIESPPEHGFCAIMKLVPDRRFIRYINLPKIIKVKHLLTALSFVALHCTALADDITPCGPKNRSDDQNCALGKTPLTRCETLGEYKRGDKQLNNNYRRLTKQLDSHSLLALKTTQGGLNGETISAKM